MTTTFLDNKICTFKILLSWLFPQKNILDDFPLCPQCTPLPRKRKFYFYCHLAVSEKICSSLCGFLRPPNTWISSESAKVCGFSTKICGLGTLCHLSSVPLSAPRKSWIFLPEQHPSETLPWSQSRGPFSSHMWHAAEHAHSQKLLSSQSRGPLLSGCSLRHILSLFVLQKLFFYVCQLLSRTS